MQHSPGIFTLSLDLELFWGVHELMPVAAYAERLAGVRPAIDQMLAVFAEYDMHATWASIGLLMCANKAEVLAHKPDQEPGYTTPALNPYGYIKSADNIDDANHFGPDIIDKIAKAPGQEIGTHTFSHFFCQEQGQDAAAFRADLEAAKKVSQKWVPTLDSMIFPRNQCREDYLPIMADMGLRCYRGTETASFYQPADRGGQESITRRALRLADVYLPVSGTNTYKLADVPARAPYNFPSSRYLRSYDPKRQILDGLKLRRITTAMRHAAQKGEVFHLWWHPEDFATHTDQNIAFLRQIGHAYAALRKEYDMTSKNMGELADAVDQRRAA